MELEFHHLASIIEQAVEYGITHIEFSGGGEPLQYSQMKRLFEYLSEYKKKKDLRLGLLTNGLYLTEEQINLILSKKLFSYIRLSYSEGTQKNKKIEKLFLTNLHTLLKRTRSSYGNPRIGLKCLLSHKNVDTLVGDILNIKDCMGEYWSRLDHIRIKALRSSNKNHEPKPEDEKKFKKQLYKYLFLNREEMSDDIQVDLNLRYVDPNYKCVLSPLISVVDPTGALMACWNYLCDYEQLKIGDLKIASFSELWGSDRHRQVVNSIEARFVCNARNGCPCRLVKYKDVLEKGEDLIRPDFLKSIEGFL